MTPGPKTQLGSLAGVEDVVKEVAPSSRSLSGDMSGARVPLSSDGGMSSADLLNRTDFTEVDSPVWLTAELFADVKMVTGSGIPVLWNNVSR
jgi:hypothetical protein